MDRRRFLLTSLAATLTAPLAAEAQQAGKVWRIGFLGGTTVPELVEAVRQGLRELRWTEGQHFVLEYRSADSKLEKISELAADLVRRNVDVIVVAGTALPYVKQATGNVPVVFVTADDPVSAGYVASFARPGGRMTGLTSLNVSLDAERLEILKAALPGVGRVGVLSTPHDRARSERVAATERAARSMGFPIRPSGTDRGPRPEDPFARPSDVPSRRHACRSHSQGREPWRPSSRAGLYVRVRDQSQGRQGAWPHDSAITAAAGRIR